MYADSMALLAFASHMLLLLSIACAAIDQYLLPTGPTAARLQHWVCCYGPVCIHRDKRTDRQTLYHYIDPAQHTMQVVPIIFSCS